MENSKPGWNKLCTIGGIAAMILIVYCLITMLLLIIIGGQPATLEECYSLLQNNRLIGLLRLDTLTVLIIPFYYLLFLGIWVALRKTHAAYTTLATVLAFVGITLFLSTPSVFPLVSLSDKYAAATTEEQRLQFLAAGEAILASGMWNSTSAIIGGILLHTAAVLISIVMLWSNVFSKMTAYVGILTYGLDLVHILIGFFLPGVSVILMAIAGPLYLIWFPLVGFRLLRIGQSEVV
jgi:hypothetical protein